MFNFTPLLGAQSESPASQSLLELDGGVKILVDVGWDVTFDAKKLESLEKHVSTLSIVLLTHATIDHLGAYAHCCKHVPLFSKVPVYATTPVINLGRSLVNDLYASSPLSASIIPASSISSESTSPEPAPKLLLQAPTYDEIASYFALINPLKYSQPHQPVPSPFSPTVSGLTITAYGAGHTLGGTIWHIQHGLESIVYAADWNQGRENLSSGASWLSSTTGGAEIIEPLRRPTALVCSSKGVEKTNPLPRKKRDETLIGLVRDTISQGGKVLIPTDTSARVLELAFVLNQTWQDNAEGPNADIYKNATIYMASKSSSSSVRYLQSMVEWVDDSVRGEAEAAMTKGKGQGRSVGLLDFTHVKQIEREGQVKRALSRAKPCVMLASDTSMEWGFSKQALEALAADSKNLLILTEKSSRLGNSDSGVGRSLWDAFQNQQGQASNQGGAKVVDTNGMVMEIQTASTEALNEDEDALFQTYAARQQQMLNTVQDDSMGDATQTADLADDQASDSSDSEDEDEDVEHQGRALNLSAQVTQSNKRKVGLTDAELGINVLLRGKNVYDYDVRNKRGREKMFPFMAHKNRTDDFGDLIKPEDYLRAEERDDTDGVDTRPGTEGEAAVGEKRRWDDSATGAKGAAKSKPQSKRSKTDGPRAPDDIDAIIAKATGQGERRDGDANGVPGAEGGESGSDDSGDENEESVPEGPRKIVFTSHSLTLNLRIAHVDFSGLHEKRDLQMLIPLIRPRKLILIAGEQSETQLLADECRQLLGSEGETAATDIFAPIIGEMVNASVDTNAWSLKLSRQLVKKLTWQNVKGLGIVALTGQLDLEVVEPEKAKERETPKKKQKLIKAEEPSETKDIVKASGEIVTVPILDLLAATSAAASAPPQHITQPVHVGDLRLASLRQLVQSSGHTAEFRGEGTLLIDGTVVVRKSASGKIEVEAGAGGLRQPQFRTKENEGSFYAVRKLIYDGLAVVAGV